MPKEHDESTETEDYTMNVFRRIDLPVSLLVFAALLGMVAVACGPKSSPTPIPVTAVSASAVEITSDIKDFALEDIEVVVGSKVNWTNQDSARHTTTSGSQGNTTGMWNSGPLGQGQSFSFTLSEVGTFKYFCQLHPTSMNATITVVTGGQ